MHSLDDGPDAGIDRWINPFQRFTPRRAENVTKSSRPASQRPGAGGHRGSAVDQYAEEPIKSIEKADLDIKKDEDEAEDGLADGDVNTLIAQFKITLENKVEDVIASALFFI